MNAHTYIVYIKSSETTQKTLKIKATGYVNDNQSKTVQFQDSDTVVAIFNMAELIGFVESGHVVN